MNQQTPASILEQINQAVKAVLPLDLADDVKKNVQSVMRNAFERMDLVTREEFEVQEKVLMRTREKLEELSQQLEALEKQLKNRPE